MTGGAVPRLGIAHNHMISNQVTVELIAGGDVIMIMCITQVT
jgi:hypothetical protein